MQEILHNVKFDWIEFSRENKGSVSLTMQLPYLFSFKKYCVMDIRKLLEKLLGEDLSPESNPNIKVFVGTTDDFMKHLEKELSGDEDEDFAVGDTVKLVNAMAITYFFDYDTGHQLSKNFEMPEKALMNFFQHAHFKVLKVLEPRVPFNCGHCDSTHYHNVIIEETSLKKKYYAQFKFLSKV